MSWLTKQSVVVPVDFSEDSLQAVAVGLEFLTDPSRLHVIHVVRPWGATDPEVMETIPDKDRLNKAQSHLDEQLSALGHTQVSSIVVIGNPGLEITRYAEKVEADLIVMPSHGRTGLSRLALGSVAERVARMAHCPILILRQ
jgi:nucleotide-binding universal stress UspA family protein